MGDARRLSPREGLYPPRGRVRRGVADSPREIHATERDGGFCHARISVVGRADNTGPRVSDKRSALVRGYTG
jgi:hypothetical protein